MVFIVCNHLVETGARLHENGEKFLACLALAVHTFNEWADICAADLDVSKLWCCMLKRL
jgi:hypothetical protein